MSDIETLTVLLQTEKLLLLSFIYGIEKFALFPQRLNCFLFSLVLSVVNVLSNITTLNVIVKYRSAYEIIISLWAEHTPEFLHHWVTKLVILQAQNLLFLLGRCRQKVPVKLTSRCAHLH